MTVQAIIGVICLVSVLSLGPGAAENSLTDLKAKAGRGDPVAQSQLGEDYLVGQGVEIDKAKAFELFKKAAAAGYPSAQYDLGVAYWQGFGTEVNSTAALVWVKRAADQGLVEAEAYLGEIYHVGGPGLPKNEVEANKWLKMAAEGGDATSCKWMADCYAHGDGVPQDVARAIAWVFNPATQGDAQACAMLAGYYTYNGDGVTPNLTLAWIWSDIALQKARGDEPFVVLVKNLQGSLLKTMKAPDLAEAKDREKDYLQASANREISLSPWLGNKMQVT